MNNTRFSAEKYLDRLVDELSNGRKLDVEVRSVADRVVSDDIS
jgi:hypothetical protein